MILVGERLATSPGALTAAARLAARTGARLAWVPRRAGDRGAVETGCLPEPAARWPPRRRRRRPRRRRHRLGRRLPARDPRPRRRRRSSPRCVAGELGGLVVGGVDPDDTADPAATRAAIEAASFVVALELRETDVTRAADVVFPVAPAVDKAGMFVTWEGRPRPFDVVLGSPQSLPDLRVLAGIAEELGRPLGFRTVAEARAAMIEMGPWDGERAPLAADAAHRRAAAADERLAGMRLATWKQMIDLGSMQDGDEALRATARMPVARVAGQRLRRLRTGRDRHR